MIDANPPLSRAALLRLFGQEGDIALYVNHLALHPEDDEIRLKLAKIHLNLGHIDTAQAETEKVLSSSPAQISGLRLLGIIYVAKNDFTAAQEVYQRIFASNPETLPEKQLINFIHGYYRVELHLNNQAHADHFLQEWVQRHPQNTLAVEIGKIPALRDEGQAEEALTQARALWASNPSHSHVLNVFASLLREAGHFEEAAEIYRQCLAVNPRNGRAASNLAYCENRLPDRQNITSSPDQHKTHIRLAEHHLKLGTTTLEQQPGQAGWDAAQPDLLAAIDSANAALEIKPTSRGALYVLGYACMRAGRHDEALQACDRLEAQKGEHPSYLVLRALTLRNMGRKEEANAAFDRAEILSLGSRNKWPRNLEVIYTHGHESLHKGNYEEALKVCDHLQSIEGDSAGQMKLRAYTLNAMGRKDEAQVIFDKLDLLSLETDTMPRSTQVFYEYAYDRLQAGDYDAALNTCNRLDAIVGDTDRQLRLRGRVLMAMGREEEARVIFDTLDDRRIETIQAHIPSVLDLLAEDGITRTSALR